MNTATQHKLAALHTLAAAGLLPSDAARTILRSMTSDEQRLADLITLPREQYIQKYFRGHVGQGVSMSDAAREFGVSHPQISIWTGKGLIKKLGRDPHHAQKVLVDRADVAYCVDAMRRLDVKQGQRLFRPDGSLYLPKELQFA